LKNELTQYQVESGNFWQALPMLGVDGYSAITLAEKRGWRVVASWGRDGYDLGSWPLVIVFHRNHDERFEVIEYVEGDVTMYSCPTEEVSNTITDEIAFFHWKHLGESWVANYESVDQLPEELRGPYRRV
jgi:hypothetical protein